ncbi:MAG: hypothetical protein QW279_06760 [Candidatus Jordarchaeaceae archaeon]
MKRLTMALSAILLFVPIIVVSQNKITDMFVTSIYAVAQKTLNAGFYQIEPYPTGSPIGNWDWQGHANGISYYPATAIIYATLSLVTGIPLDVLVFIPLGIVFLIIAFLVLTREIFRNKLFVFAYLLIQIFYLRITYTLSYHILGFFFHTIILIVLFKKFHGKLQDSPSSLTLFLLISITSLTYYTAAAWNLVFLTSTLVIVLLFKFRNIKGEGQKLNFILVFTLFAAVLYFLCDRQFYKYIKEHQITEILVNFVTYLGSRLTGSTVPMLKERYSILTYDPLGRVLSYFPLAMMIFSIIYVSISLITKLRSKSKTLTMPLTFFTGIVACGTFENLAYFSYTQTIGNRYFQLFGLLISFYAINNFLNRRKQQSIRKKLWHILAAILAILIISSAFYNVYYGVFRGNVAIRSNAPMQCESSSNWLAEHTSHSNIVSEHQTSGFIFASIISANKSDSIRVFPLNEDIYILYEALIENDERTLSNLFSERTYYTIVFLKMFNKNPMFGDVWGYAVPPLDGQKNNLNNFTIFNKIYDDGNAEIFNYNR